MRINHLKLEFGYPITRPIDHLDGAKYGKWYPWTYQLYPYIYIYIYIYIYVHPNIIQHTTYDSYMIMIAWKIAVGFFHQQWSGLLKNKHIHGSSRHIRYQILLGETKEASKWYLKPALAHAQLLASESPWFMVHVLD